MGRGHRPLAGERVGADASDGHQHAYCVDEGARLAEEVAGEEDHDEPPDSVEHGVRRHLHGQRRWNRRLWVGTGAPPQAVVGVHAATALPSGHRAAVREQSREQRPFWRGGGRRGGGAPGRGVLSMRRPR